MQLKKNGPISYFVQGSTPKVFFRSGTHGDENGVIDSVWDAIHKHLDRLPDFLFIPEVSPSAVLSGTRANEHNLDMNRGFVEDSQEPEVIANMSIVKDFQFDLSFDFHEDISGFYFYDSEQMDDQGLARVRTGVNKLGVGLYSGIDDPDDPALVFKVEGGYTPKWIEKYDPNAGFYDSWTMKNDLVRRSITVEIPKELSVVGKKRLVNLLFDELVLPLI